MYIRKSNSCKTGPSGTPHVILEVLDAKPLIDTNCLHCFIDTSCLLNMIQIICLLIHVFHNDIICSTECYDPQYQKPFEGQQKYHMQSYHHQELSLLPQSDLTEHMKLNNAAESQLKRIYVFIKKIIDSVVHAYQVNHSY